MHSFNLILFSTCRLMTLIELFQIKSNNQPNREEIYTKNVEVLEPIVSKLMAFMKFTVKPLS